MERPGTSCKTKGSLGEQEISDLFSDELSEAPLGSDSDMDSGSDWGKHIYPQSLNVKVTVKAALKKVWGQSHGEQLTKPLIYGSLLEIRGLKYFLRTLKKCLT
jgi:hypothetical protein